MNRHVPWAATGLVAYLAGPTVFLPDPLPVFARDTEARAWDVEGRAREALGQHNEAGTAFKHAAGIQADMVAGIPVI